MYRVKKHVGTHHLTGPWRLMVIFLLLNAGAAGLIFSAKSYQQVFATSIRVEKTSDVSLTDPIVVDFSEPMRQNSIGSIRVEARSNHIKADTKFFWSDGNRKLTITSKSAWKAGENYELILSEGSNVFFVPTEGTRVIFSTVAYPRVKEVFPADGAKDIAVDIEEPITVTLDRPAKDFFIKLETSPAIDIASDTDSEKTVFKFVSKAKMFDGTAYSIKVLARPVSDKDIPENYKKIFESTFTTRSLPAVDYKADKNTRLEQAKVSTVPRVLTGKYIDVNLKSQVMSTFEDGKMLGAYLISSGKAGMPTPKGEHKIYNKSPRAYSKEYGLYMPRWMAILPDGKVGIHELPEWPGGYKEGANHLGIPVSHGCIRLGVGSAEAVYSWAEIGTRVIVY